ncbi:MAG: hypothetical protein AB7P09_14060 [Pyrinomonadaceae bacterium]
MRRINLAVPIAETPVLGTAAATARVKLREFVGLTSWRPRYS